MTFSGYNTKLPNFAYDAANYADNSAQIKGVGCAGTNEGVLASKSVFVEPPYIMKGGKRYRRKGMRSKGKSMRSKGKGKRSKSKRSKSKRSKRSKSNKKYRGGNSGYEFTNTPIAPVAGPGAPYSEVKAYNNTLGNYRTVFPALFKGGKKHMQYGCNNKSHKHYKRTAKRTTKRSLNAKRAQIAKRMTKRNWMASRQRMMKGGMSSASDFTDGRNSSQDQPYGNKAISFGQGLDSMLGPNESALASPPPFLPYNNCGKYART